jgi:queuine tRNA-ribosyltransferase
MKLKNSRFAKDMRPVDETCSCMVCKQYTRSYLHHAIKAGIAAPAILITYHNVAYMQVSRACVG